MTFRPTRRCISRTIMEFTSPRERGWPVEMEPAVMPTTRLPDSRHRAGSRSGTAEWFGTRRFTALLAIMFVITGVITGAGRSTVEPLPDARPATAAEHQALLRLYRKYERAFFDAMVHGDPTYFVSVLYNDPETEIDHVLTTLIAEYRDQVDAVLAESRGTGPIGSGDGILSARNALVERVNQGSAAWEAEEERAAAAGDSPSIGNLPEGIAPYQRPVASEWIDDVPVQLINIQVGGNHATADAVFVDEEQLAEYVDRENPYMVHLTFTQIDGRWYISNYYGTGNP